MKNENCGMGNECIELNGLRGSIRVDKLRAYGRVNKRSTHEE